MESPDKHKILIVDDYPNNLFVLELMLEHPHYQIFKADCGQAALRQMMQEQIDLVILDVRLPDISGFELAQLMRESRQRQHIPIIFLSGDARINNDCPDLTDFLLKPIEAELLREKVAALLASRTS